MLASPATGPVERVWYSAGGSMLFARTPSGKVFETADFETWAAAADVAETNAPIPAAPPGCPSLARRVVSTAGNPSIMYSLDGSCSAPKTGAFLDQPHGLQVRIRGGFRPT